MQLTVKQHIKPHFSGTQAGHAFCNLLIINAFAQAKRDIKVSRYRDIKVSRLKSITILIINLLKKRCPANVPVKQVLNICKSGVYTCFINFLAGHFPCFTHFTNHFSQKRFTDWLKKYSLLQLDVKEPFERRSNGTFYIRFSNTTPTTQQ